MTSTQNNMISKTQVFKNGLSHIGFIVVMLVLWLLSLWLCCWNSFHIHTVAYRLNTLKTLISWSQTRLFSSIVNDNKNKLKILCLHGYLSNSYNFQYQLRHLIDKIKPIAEFGMSFD